MSQRSSVRSHQAPGGSSQMGSLIFGGGDDSSFDDSQRNRRGVRSQQRPEAEQHPLDHRAPAGQQGRPQQQNPLDHRSGQQQYQQDTYQQPQSSYQQQQDTRQQPQQQRPQASSAPFAQDSDTGIGRVSSNRFASGVSQNTGNVITDRSTTRIHAPPGGASSFRLG
ncbi:hypothetical protein ACHHYP_02038 [Achlya hypogyna]|uniref:Uncharacterized protein n=1 Tax=Achlya hypogyna TaxID=1202772 RepID=A0A1V9ZSP5_ACHHY|nr:hypothetical protein ACHHYP_02038 [Achlya hypogyna]